MVLRDLVGGRSWGREGGLSDDEIPLFVLDEDLPLDLDEDLSIVLDEDRWLLIDCDLRISPVSALPARGSGLRDDLFILSERLISVLDSRVSVLDSRISG